MKKLTEEKTKALTDKIIELLSEKRNGYIGLLVDEKTRAHSEGFRCGLDWAIHTIAVIEETAKFEEIVRVLMKHLGYRTDLYHPHHTAIITNTRAELVEGEKGIKTNDYIKD